MDNRLIYLSYVCDRLTFKAESHCNAMLSKALNIFTKVEAPYRINNSIWEDDYLITIVNERKFRWYGHI